MDPKVTLQRINSTTERVLIGMSGVFLLAYALPILKPDLDPWIGRACDGVLIGVWVAFGVHYILGLVNADQRVRWVATHWFDLLLLLVPFLRPLRVLQLVLLLRVVNTDAKRRLHGQVGAYVAVGSSLLGFVAALAVLDAERGAPDALITTFGDAVWWAITTMTTVGYGDLYPVTDTGRLIAAGLMVGGIAMLGSVTATLATWMIDAVASEDEEAELAQAAREDRQFEVLMTELTELRAEVGRLGTDRS